MKIESVIIKRINTLLHEAHKREDRKSVERLEKQRGNYLKRWLIWK